LPTEEKVEKAVVNLKFSIFAYWLEIAVACGVPHILEM
jgi:hypothetical protein